MTVSSEVEICNLAQDILGAEAIASINAPRSANEKRYARQYPVQRDAELRKRRWNFSKYLATITPTGEPIQTDRTLLYRYEWPVNALRAIRESGSMWIPGGRQLLSETNGTLRVWFIVVPPVGDFDALFVPMLAAKLAEVLCEAVTQSNEKKKDATEKYEMARREAAAANAFEIGPEVIASDDASFSWVQSRYA